MIRSLALAACFCALACLSSVAEARPRGHHFADAGNIIGCADPVMRPCDSVVRKSRTTQRIGMKGRFVQLRDNPVIQRPRAWCGWFARFNFLHRDPGPAFNLARNWARVGSRAHGPAIGTVVVWRHHVGKIVGRASNGQWIVLSGNDGNRVRTRPRSVSNAIAFRWP